MPKGNMLSRLLIVTLTAAAVAAPAAVAMPIDPTGPSDAAQVSAEPSVAQDLRGEAARARRPHRRAPGPALRGHEGPDARPLPGPPTWPVNPQVIATPNEPVPADGGDGGGSKPAGGADHRRRAGARRRAHRRGAPAAHAYRPLAAYDHAARCGMDPRRAA